MSIEGELKARIEAALYASGRPLSPEDLAKAAGITSKRKAVKAARSLAAIINSTLSAIRIEELGDQKFVMQLRPGLNLIAKRFATRPLVPYSVLKTLSYVAYFQPITSQELSSRRGTQAYRHLKTLEGIGFVTAEPLGRTRLYRTTSAFSEYFGLSSEESVMKEQLNRLGLKRPTGKPYSGRESS